MVRRASRVDRNQKAVADGLRRVGASVQHLYAVGQGCPDLLVGGQGTNYLLEVKRPAGPRGGLDGRHLTPDQAVWHRGWAGQVAVVRSVSEALREIGAVE